MIKLSCKRDHNYRLMPGIHFRGKLSESCVSFYLPDKNEYRKNGYIVDCADLIEPLFLHSSFPPTEKLLLDNTIWLLVFYETERNGT